VREPTGERYNKARQFRAQLRRREVLRLLGEVGWTYGSQAAIAWRLGCSPATVSRDVGVLMPLVEACPTRGPFRPRAWGADA
jgi:hypothetical protein